MKVAIFGASVSAQTVRYDTGEVVGYTEFLRVNHAEELGIKEIRSFAYPGNRLSDAGMVRVRDVIEYAPDICIFEPMVEDESRGHEATWDDATYIFDSFITNNIVPVVLSLPWPTNNNQTDRYRILTELCRQYGVPLIEFPLPESDCDAHFNSVHTTAKGGAYYAYHIASALRSLPTTDDLLVNLQSAWRSPSELWRVTTVPCSDTATYSRMVLEIIPILQSNFAFRAIQHQTIGTFSPVFTVTLSDDRGRVLLPPTKETSWDIYCHYSRKSFVSLVSSAISYDKFYITIHKIDESPDYTDCKRHDVEWPPISDLHFLPDGPIYIISNQECSINVIECS